jgi:hypothetical protein
MSETLDGALTELFGGSAAPRGPAGPSVAALPGGAPLGDAAFRAAVAEARRRYQSAMQAQRAGDWARYGEEIRQLGELLERIGAGGAQRSR